jgi:hypothetical protein
VPRRWAEWRVVQDRQQAPTASGPERSAELFQK